MRYKEGEVPDPLYPHTFNMHAMLTLSIVMALLIGAILLYLGIRGKVMWLKFWSIGLILCSLGYLTIESFGLLR